MCQMPVVQGRGEQELMDTGTGCLDMAGNEQLDLPPGCSGCGFGFYLATEVCGSWRLGRFGGCAAPASLVLAPVCSLSVEKHPCLAGCSPQTGTLSFLGMGVTHWHCHLPLAQSAEMPLPSPCLKDGICPEAGVHSKDAAALSQEVRAERPGAGGTVSQAGGSGRISAPSSTR